MTSFGEQLRRERERRNATIEQIADSTKIGRSYLEALEQNEFDGLPGGAFGKLYIRAYAEVLGFDPQPLIDEYDRERHRRSRPDPASVRERPAAPARRKRRPRAWLQEQANLPQKDPAAAPASPSEKNPDPVPPPAAPPPADDEPPANEVASLPETCEPSRSPRPRALAIAGFAVLALATWFALTRSGRDAAPAGAEPAPSVPVEAAAPEATALPAPSLEAGELPVATPPPVEEAVPPPSRLRVAEHGFGRNVIGRRLVEPGERFEEGSVVWFATRVLGGGEGDFVRHVWKREGRLVESIRLSVPAAHWRTQSRKTLWGTGRWTVEVRDPDGRLLATAGFDCVPAGSL